MKIRTDYVTNSSSSSFILSFRDENSIYETLKEQFPKDIEEGWSYGDNGYMGQLLSEIEGAIRLTENDIKEIVDDESWNIRWDLERKLEDEKNMSYSEVREFFETSEGKRMIENACKDEFDRIMKEIGNDKVIVQVEHGDGGEGEDGMLEHEILPSLDCTKIRFSHH